MRELFDRFYVFNYRRMYERAFKLTHDKEEAKDLIQETYLKIAVYVSKHKVDSFEAFSYSTMKNVFLNNRRRRRITVVLVDFQQDTPEIQEMLETPSEIYVDLFTPLKFQKLRREILEFVYANR